MLKLSVSNANSKMGSIKSISMPRIKTCAPGVPCAKTCYVSHFDWRTTVRNAYDNNLNLWLTDPDGFEVQATAAAYVAFKDGYCEAPADAYECSGHCEDCAYAGKNCWVMGRGQSIVLKEH